MNTPTKTVVQHHLPPSSIGNTRTLTAIRYGKNVTGTKAYIQAGLHADEPPGSVVMHHLINLLDRADAKGWIEGEILLVPVSNPIGVSQWRDDVLRGRMDFCDTINFNRNHPDVIEQVAESVKDHLTDTPGLNVSLIREAMGEAIRAIAPGDETAHLKHLLFSLSYDADIVLDLHCDFQAVLHVYTGTPLWPGAADLSAQLGAEVTLLAKDSGDNPYDEACSRIWWELAGKFPDHPIPSACLAATVELRGMADVTHALAEKDAENIVLFLKRRGFIQGQAPDVPPLKSEATPLRGVEHVKAPVPGVVVFLKAPGEPVEKGEVIAEIVNPVKARAEERLTPVKSGTPGIFFSRIADRFARPGRILGKIAGKEPIKGKKGKLLTM